MLQVQIMNTVAVNHSSNPDIKRGEQYAVYYMLIMTSLCNLFNTDNVISIESILYNHFIWWQ
jgi:hypothetical protein